MKGDSEGGREEAWEVLEPWTVRIFSTFGEF